jgi:hypothetical protein
LSNLASFQLGLSLNGGCAMEAVADFWVFHADDEELDQIDELNTKPSCCPLCANCDGNAHSQVGDTDTSTKDACKRGSGVDVK